MKESIVVTVIIVAYIVIFLITVHFTNMNKRG